MSFKDFFKFLSMKEPLKIDYIVFFKNDRPEINNYDNLKKVGNWKKYGEDSYRLFCNLSEDKFENLIIEELKINKDDFKLIRINFFPGF